MFELLFLLKRRGLHYSKENYFIIAPLPRTSQQDGIDRDGHGNGRRRLRTLAAQVSVGIAFASSIRADALEIQIGAIVESLKR